MNLVLTKNCDNRNKKYAIVDLVELVNNCNNGNREYVVTESVNLPQNLIKLI